MKLVLVGVWIGLTGAISLAGTAPLAAQQGGGPKVGYVNTQAILKQTPGYTKAESTFTKELETYRIEVQKLQATLDSSASDFDQQSVMLSPTQRSAKRKDLHKPSSKSWSSAPKSCSGRPRPGSGSCSSRSRARSTP
jgi:Skp family chaperone for outer membrane proteins